MQNPKRLAYLLLLAVVLVWGTTFALVKSALADAPPLLFNLLRMTIAFLVLLAGNWKGVRSASHEDLRYGIVAGAFLGMGYQFQTSGLALTTASKAAFITGLVVVIVPLLSSLPKLRPEGVASPCWGSFAGAAAAFIGLVLLTTRPGERSLRGLGRGEALCLACAVAFALHLIILAHAARRTTVRTLATLQIGFAALLMAATLPMAGHVRLFVTPRLLLTLAVTSVLATAAAFTIQSWAQQHLSATHTALIFTLEPVFAWLTSLLFLKERLGTRELSGAALILAGVLMSELGGYASGTAEIPA